MHLPDSAQGLDAELRHAVYHFFVEHQRAPGIPELAWQLGLSSEAARASLDRLAAGHALVLDPASGELLMAPPFSAVPTAFRARIGERSWWAPCAWDALGVAAALGADAEVETACPDCEESLSLAVEAATGRVGVKAAAAPGPGNPPTSEVMHVAVPARRWWEDIVFT